MHLSHRYKVRATMPVTVTVEVIVEAEFDSDCYEIDPETCEVELTDRGFQHVLDEAETLAMSVWGHRSSVHEVEGNRWHAAVIITDENGNEVDLAEVPLGELEA